MRYCPYCKKKIHPFQSTKTRIEPETGEETTYHTGCLAIAVAEIVAKVKVND